MDYAVLDIEATGGKKGEEKIIEIAIYRFDGKKITDKFGAMVNPERPIDPYVQKLTGITNKMVKRSPKFFELAKRVIEITEGCIIVGHGVSFDYRMLKQEFRELGFDYQRDTMDTLSLSQNLLVEAPSHSLGKLAKWLGIPMRHRHRADGDTLITLELFKILLEKDVNKKIIQSFANSEPNSPEQVSKLLNLEKNQPSKMGVYYLHDAAGKVFYLNAARNIKRQINKNFSASSQEALRLQSQVSKITHEFSGSWLIAQIKFNEESKRIKTGHFTLPKTKYCIGLYLFRNKQGDWEMEADQIQNRNIPPILLFSTWKKARKTQEILTRKFSDESNQKILPSKIKEAVEYPYPHFLLIDRGREKGEKSFIEIESGKLKGYGFYTLYHQLENAEIRRHITTETDEDSWAEILVKTFVFQGTYKELVELEGC